MKSKTISLILTIIIVILFGVMLFSKHLYFNKFYQFGEEIAKITKFSENEQWIEANNQLKRVEKIWHTGKYLLLLNYAEQDFTDISTEFVELKWALKSKDQHKIEQLVNQIMEHLTNFNSIIPEP